MKFTVLDIGIMAPGNSELQAFLIKDKWDDFFSFSTQYYLVINDEKADQNRIGLVKVAQIGMAADQRRANLPTEFENLDSIFFSLGQDEEYYENLNRLGSELRALILKSLNDIALDLDFFKKVFNENVTQRSLLRSVTEYTVMGQFHRLSIGGAKLTEYKFTYLGRTQTSSSGPPLILDFKVEPESKPPTNIHVLIGKNGVGKTYILNAMTRALVDKTARKNDVGEFSHDDAFLGLALFANVVSVTFSAFDRFNPIPYNEIKSENINYAYIGLKNIAADNDKKHSRYPKSPSDLANEFVESIKICRISPRKERWIKALETLETDPIFATAEISNLTNYTDDNDLNSTANTLFSNLSSGHKIVLYTITKLVETVEEKTLVVIDEPEAHLHPPLLSAFIRSLSDLLINRNGIAVIATHSPVVLQEVPKRCVWKIRRSGDLITVERPDIETFGENVGILTREIFGLEVTNAGFHKMLIESIGQFNSYDEVVQNFNGELGDEAKAIVKALIIQKINRNPN